MYGDLDGQGTCDVPQTIAAGGSYSCSFSGAGQRQRRQLTRRRRHRLRRRRRRQRRLGARRCDCRITDLASSIRRDEVGEPDLIAGAGWDRDILGHDPEHLGGRLGDDYESVDDVYGDLDGKGTCDVPQTIAPGASYDCSFSGAVSGNAGSSHKDEITASGTDDDGNPVSGKDDATVAITDLPSSITVTKSANPTSLPEPGGSATFSATVENTSAVDSVTITSLVDDVYGDLDGKGTCDVPQTLAAGASYSCSFSGAVSGNAGSSHRDEITASGTDDDGNPGLRQGRRDGRDHRPAQLDRGDEVGEPVFDPGAGRHRDVLGLGEEHVGGRLDLDHEPDGQRVREPRREGHVRRAADAGCGSELHAAPSPAPVSGGAGSSHIDVVTASGIDDDENEISGSDDATVTITAAPTPPPPAGAAGSALWSRPQCRRRSTSRSRRPTVPTRSSSAPG